MTSFIQVSTTIDSREGAQKIAETLVGQRLAACIHIIGPIRSTYWWKGVIEEAEEWICNAKTREELYSKVEEAIREVHPYEVPDIVATSLVAGSRSYLDWIAAETTKP